MSDKKTIKSLVLTEPYKMRLEERPVPMPGPFEVLIRVESRRKWPLSLHLMGDTAVGS